MKVFELKYVSGPHGDACSTHDIIINQPNLSVREFIQALNPDEWGVIYIITKNPDTYDLPYATENERYQEIEVKYKYGKIKTDLAVFNHLLDKIIDVDYKNWSNGGWGCMNYWIKVKE